MTFNIFKKKIKKNQPLTAGQHTPAMIQSMKQSQLKIYSHFTPTCCLQYPPPWKMLSYFSSICSSWCSQANAIWTIVATQLWVNIWQKQLTLALCLKKVPHNHKCPGNSQLYPRTKGRSKRQEKKASRYKGSNKNTNLRYPSSLLSSHIPFFSSQKWLQVQSVKNGSENWSTF